MRAQVPLRSLDAVAWQPAGVPGIEIKPLNADPESGARTSLLRSAVRTTVEQKAQYHPGDEEFLCLEGRFTFDGREWFEAGSYVHFPPHTVHGAEVQVPGGYLLYLRTTGTAEAHRVAEPRHRTPYSLDAPDGASPATIRRVGTAGDHRTTAGAQGASECLRRAERGTGEAIWTTLRAGESLRVGGAAGGEPLEILLVSGSLRLGSAETVHGPAYGCYPRGLGDTTLVADSDATILTHTGALA